MKELQFVDYSVEIEPYSHLSFSGKWMHEAKVTNIETGLYSWITISTDTEDKPTEQSFFEKYSQRMGGEWRKDEFGALIWHDATEAN